MGIHWGKGCGGRCGGKVVVVNVVRREFWWWLVGRGGEGTEDLYRDNMYFIIKSTSKFNIKTSVS